MLDHYLQIFEEKNATIAKTVDHYNRYPVCLIKRHMKLVSTLYMSEADNDNDFKECDTFLCTSAPPFIIECYIIIGCANKMCQKESIFLLACQAIFHLRSIIFLE